MSEPAAERAPSGPAGLSPLRRTLLDQLAEPASASELARRLGLPRQRINYHLRELERLGLVELVDERRRRGFVERRVRAVDRDRHSSAYLYTAASRLAADVAALRRRAAAAGRPLATFTLELDIDFASPAAMGEFLDELAAATRTIAARHHRPDDPRARRHRLVIGAHQAITDPPEEAAP
ncbi:ArsR/SmtB family transcription factor [Actinomadura sp. 21ATH]|uniref:ArsR/SmtB family transcription factor n=1 Tax=Actinomadura sp. 21ATH TaxID=1735444 RepID=UPI0035C080D2